MKKLLENKKINIIVTSVLLALSLVLVFVSGHTFHQFAIDDAYFKTDNVTRIEKFSKYSKLLEGTSGDSNIYIIEGSQPGPSILVMGGTHPNEPAGQLAATLILENIQVTKGTVYVITEANRSAYTVSYPQEASPMYYTIETPTGDRVFKYGSRATNFIDQWPNPDIYVHATSGQKLSANETRNINRAYPGRENGTYTERVAYAITECIKQNNITMVLDLHEASPEYNNINTMVAHQRALDIASNAKLWYFEAECEARINIEASALELHGLTHRELGDYTDAYVFLCETSNASQGKLRGAFTEDLITYTKKDKYYEYAKKLNGVIYGAPVDISERVARHVMAFYSIVSSYNDLCDTMSLSGLDNAKLNALYALGDLEMTIPSYDDIMTNKVGYYL